jgi:hypothetical protein
MAPWHHLLGQRQQATSAWLLTSREAEGWSQALGSLTYTFGAGGHVLMAIYFDRRSDLDVAKKIWLSISETQK